MCLNQFRFTEVLVGKSVSHYTRGLIMKLGKLSVLVPFISLSIFVSLLPTAKSSEVLPKCDMSKKPVMVIGESKTYEVLEWYFCTIPTGENKGNVRKEISVVKKELTIDDAIRYARQNGIYLPDRKDINFSIIFNESDELISKIINQANGQKMFSVQKTQIFSE